MDKEAVEILKIYDFLSIRKMDWEIRQFNIITGDMGAGKSLCIKLLKFFEDIVPNLLVFPYEKFLKNLDAGLFFSYLAGEFSNIFVFSASEPVKRPMFRINYTFTYNEVSFDISVSGKDENDIVFESVYLRTLLQEWHEYCHRKDLFSSVTPDGFDEVKQYLYTELLRKFGDCFPVSTIFVPASRAALVFGSGHTDDYLNQYKKLVDVLPRFKSRNQELFDTILKAQMRIEDDFVYLESSDGRKVPIAKASSGQQEIIYVLMLLDKLGNFRYNYGKEQAVFIEEPSVHLFPLEQKQTIELITWLYNELKETERSVRFFITTHSPYVLNSINNILKKGSLLEEYREQADRINKSADIPHLYVDEVSAYFIDNKGNGDSMLDRDEKYIFADKIAEISFDIDQVTATLSQLNNELLGERE